MALMPRARRRFLEDELAEVATERGIPRPRAAPLLDRAVALIANALPASEADIARRLITAGLARGSLELAPIERALRFRLGAPPFLVLRREALVLAVSPGRLAFSSTVYGLAVRAVVNWGLAAVRGIGFQANADDLTTVTAIVSARDTFRWLDRPHGWFWFHNERLSVVRAIEKTLHVARSIRLEKLAQILFRRWPPDTLPPLRALHELCAQVSFFRVAHGQVSFAEAPADPVMLQLP